MSVESTSVGVVTTEVPPTTPIRAVLTAWIAEVYGRWKARGDRFAAGPLSPAVLVILTIMAGLIASRYDDEILTSWPFAWSIGPISKAALLFWTASVSAAALYFRRQCLIDVERSRTIHSFEARAQELNQTAMHLQRLIRTMPPADFLSLHSQIYQDAASVVARTSSIPVEKLSPDDVRKTVRGVLDCVATLAHVFDGREDAVYGTNIMLYRATSEMHNDELERYNDLLEFREDGTDVRQLRGILILEKGLSTSTDVKGPEADPRLREFALPIPRVAWSGDKSKVLPGAPSAFTKDGQGFEGYWDTRTIGDWCEARCELSAGVVRRFRAYFGEEMGDRIRSFVSIPLTRPGEKSPCAVLNIHRNVPDVLRDREAAEHFVALIGPMKVLIVQLIDLLHVVSEQGLQAGTAPV